MNHFSLLESRNKAAIVIFNYSNVKIDYIDSTEISQSGNDYPTSIPNIRRKLLDYVSVIRKKKIITLKIYSRWWQNLRGLSSDSV